MRRAISASGVTSTSSSAKSMPASSSAISSTSACFTGATRRLSAPPIWLAAWRACVKRLRLDQVAHRLGLRQIELARQKGALR